MKNKKIWYIGLIILVISCVTGGYLFFSESNKKNNNVLSNDKLRAIAELATLKTYYHNVAEFSEDGAKLFLRNKRVEWIEYSGTVEIGTDISQLEMKKHNNNITITIPHSDILKNGCKINPNSLKKSNYYVFYDGFFPDKLTVDDQQRAFRKSQKKMEIEARNNKLLFVQADERAEELLKNYVKKVGKVTGQKYKIVVNYK